MRLARSSLCAALLERGEEGLAVLIARAGLPDILDSARDAPALAAEASVLKVASAWNDTNLRRAVMDWHGAEAGAHDGAGGEASQQYLSIPSILIGGGTLEIQLNVIGELVLGMPRS
jgi:alkylation response protein AidB-like acyl-CoA dehydrogenase